MTTATSNARASLEAIKTAITSMWDQANDALRDLDQIDVTLSQARTAPQLALAEVIVNLLNGENKLRTFDAITEATGYSREQVEDALDAADIGYVIKKRRQDGAALIGLTCRNTL